MSWMTGDNNPKTELKPIWSYREGMDFVTVLPNTSREFTLIQGDLDPTRTWNGAMSVWVHEFKSMKGGFVTIMCNKWNEACPFCYENELYKQSNPNYKQTGGRLPYGLSNKALIQVYDFQQDQILWLLAGKQIRDGMDFILQQHQHLFKGHIIISRMGERLNTNYRVDLYNATVRNFDHLNDQVVKLDDVPQHIYLSHEEIYEKSGMNPYIYFQQKQAEGIKVDISSWGAIPHENKISVKSNETVTQTANQSPPPNSNPISNHTVVQDVMSTSDLTPDMKSALEFVCKSGVYVNMKMEDVIRQTGKPYIQFLSKSGDPEEQAVAVYILGQWDSIQSYLDKSLAF